MEAFKIVACSPPRCSCPTLTVEENLQGEDMVIIADDYNGTVIMELGEFKILAKEFLAKWNS